MLRNKPLATQIWLFFGFALVLSLFLVGLVPLTLRSFFAPEIYATIEKAQTAGMKLVAKDSITLEELPFSEESEHLTFRLPVDHFILYADGRVVSSSGLPPTFSDEALNNALLQEEKVKRYESRVDSTRLFYVLRRLDGSGGEVFLVSYMWDLYRDEMVQGLFMRLLFVIAGTLLLCWLPSILLARYLSNPLVQLERHVKQIADRDWYRPIKVERQDEIGSLAASIERMRERLVQQDEAQQSFLQNVSHELKTPVMVIRSYVQSIHDGIFPQGDLTSTVKVIDEESELLEKRIQDLLYLTKIDYLSTHEPTAAKTNLKEAVEEVINRFRRRRGEIRWSVDLALLAVPGAPEQWTVVFENILDNQLRYAASRVEVSLSRQEKEGGEAFARVRLWNDGPPIDEAALDRLFQKFQRGPGGKFGLGLSIVQRIVSIYRGRVWAANENKGVAFYLELPLVLSSTG